MFTKNRNLLPAIGIMTLGFGLGVIAYWSLGQLGVAPSSTPTNSEGDARSAGAPETLVNVNGDRNGRIILALTAAERNHISSEMNAFLMGSQQIGQATLIGDRAAIREAAQALSKGNGGDLAQAIQLKTPSGFKSLSKEVRAGFGAINETAQTESMVAIQQRLFDTMAVCVSCHGTYAATEVQ